MAFLGRSAIPGGGSAQIRIRFASCERARPAGWAISPRSGRHVAHGEPSSNAERKPSNVAAALTVGTEPNVGCLAYFSERRSSMPAGRACCVAWIFGRDHHHSYRRQYTAESFGDPVRTASRFGQTCNLELTLRNNARKITGWDAKTLILQGPGILPGVARIIRRTRPNLSPSPLAVLRGALGGLIIDDATLSPARTRRPYEADRGR